MTVQAAGKRQYVRVKQRTRGRFHNWTDAETRHLQFLFACGYRGSALLAQMTENFGPGFTINNIYGKAHYLNYNISNDPDKRGPYEQTYLMRATLEHLLDLKRAGHSPSVTEFKIPPDNCAKRLEKALGASYIGSSAAMCVEA